jgi:hypothetical protein
MFLEFRFKVCVYHDTHRGRFFVTNSWSEAIEYGKECSQNGTIVEIIDQWSQHNPVWTSADQCDL